MATPDLAYVRKAPFHELPGPFVCVSGTDFHYMPPGRIYEDLTCTKEFTRLANIRQLGLVGSSCHNACQDQTRYFHSFVTGAMMDLVLYMNHFSEHDRKLGIAAGLYHDLAISPYSDQGKLLKPGCYEEETLVEHVVRNSPVIMERLSANGIDIDELVATIQGKTLVGRLLNSREGLDVDNLSYLAIDQSWMCSLKGDRRRALQKKPGIFDQYKNIRFVSEEGQGELGGDWVFENPELLLNLLEFRALMYERTYHNPFNRAKEAFLIRAMEDCARRGCTVELDELLSWTDNTYQQLFYASLGYFKELQFFAVCFEPFAEIGRVYDLSWLEPSKLAQLRAEKEKKDEQGNDLIIVERLKPPRHALNNLVLHDGKVKQLEEIPEFADQVKNIRRIIKRLDYIGVYQMVDQRR